MPATKNKPHAERKNHFSRRSKNAPKGGKPSFKEDFDLAEMLQIAKEDMAKEASDKNGGNQSVKRSPRKPISKKEINAQKNFKAEKNEASEKAPVKKGRPKKKSFAEAAASFANGIAETAVSTKKNKGKKAVKKQETASVKIIPLGGLGEIGKNMTLIGIFNSGIDNTCHNQRYKQFKRGLH